MTETIQGNVQTNQTPTVNEVTPSQVTTEQSPNPIQAPIAQVVSAVEQTEKALSAVTESALKRAEQKPQPLRVQLSVAMEMLRKSPHFPRIKSNPISIYWPAANICGQLLATWKVEDCVQHTPKELLAMKGVGKIRMQGLVSAMQFAAKGGKTESNPLEQHEENKKEDAYTWVTKLAQPEKEQVVFFFERSLDVSPEKAEVARVLRQLPRVLGFEPMVLLWREAKTSQRKVADELGVTESRISQILAEKKSKMRSVLHTELPEMYGKWMTLLASPAAESASLLSPWFNFVSTSEQKQTLLTFFMSMFEARHPLLHSGPLEDYWCTDMEALKVCARQVEEKLPMSDDELNSYVAGVYPGISLKAVRKAFGRTVTYVKDARRWFPDRRSAVDHVLSQADHPLTRVELAKAMGVKPSQTKAMLLEHDGVERIGSNLKRVYVLKKVG